MVSSDATDSEPGDGLQKTVQKLKFRFILLEQANQAGIMMLIMIPFIQLFGLCPPLNSLMPSIKLFKRAAEVEAAQRNTSTEPSQGVGLK